MPEMKTCKHCNTSKLITDFKKESKTKSGYGSICKTCHNEKNKQYHKAHKEERIQYLKEYRKSNLDKIKQYLTENADKIREHRRKYTIHKRCPKCRKHFKFSKYYGIDEPIFKCKFCGTVLRRSKTLSSNSRCGDHANGFRIKVASV